MAGKEQSPLAERFWAKVRKSDPESCWDWTAATDGRGYGRIWDRPAGRAVVAARVSWELANGRPIPGDMTIDHACRRPPCVNPKHLRLLDRAENSADAMKWRARKLVCVNGHNVGDWGRDAKGTCRGCIKMRNDRRYVKAS